MHNLKDLRKNLEFFKKKFKERNVDFDIENFNQIDQINRELINKKELLEQEKKILSKLKDKSNFEKSKKLSVKIDEIAQEQINSKKKIDNILSRLPNISNEEVPIGKDDKSNKLIKKIGNLRDFNFKIVLIQLNQPLL